MKPRLNARAEFAALALVPALAFAACTFRREKIQQASTEASFASIQANILNPSCVRCHSGPNAPHGLDLTSYEKIMSHAVFPPLVIPGNADQSSLYQACLSGAMPDGGPRLSDTDLSALRQWIQSGAPEFGVGDGNGSVPPDGGTEPGCDQGEPGECGPRPETESQG